MGIDTQYRINTLMYFIHENEFRSSSIKRIVIDEEGHAYMFQLDGKIIEKKVNEIGKTKEDVFNNLVNKFLARKQSN